MSKLQRELEAAAQEAWVVSAVYEKALEYYRGLPALSPSKEPAWARLEEVGERAQRANQRLWVARSRMRVFLLRRERRISA